VKKRIASLDYGLKRIGVAISDENKIVAFPLGVIQAGKSSGETIEKILALLKPYPLERIIIGNPLHLNGKVGFLAGEVTQFIQLLQPHVPCEISLFDERLSSLQADRSLKDAGKKRKERSQHIDAVAALLILQSYLGY